MKGDKALSMNRLAEMYMSANGVDRDHTKGRELFQRASDLGANPFHDHCSAGMCMIVTDDEAQPLSQLYDML